MVQTFFVYCEKIFLEIIFYQDYWIRKTKFLYMYIQFLNYFYIWNYAQFVSAFHKVYMLILKNRYTTQLYFWPPRVETQ